jgi:hypothetical protein
MKREVMLAAVGEGCKVNSSGLHAASNFVQDPYLRNAEEKVGAFLRKSTQRSTSEEKKAAEQSCRIIGRVRQI